MPTVTNVSTDTLPKEVICSMNWCSQDGPIGVPERPGTRSDKRIARSKASVSPSSTSEANFRNANVTNAIAASATSNRDSTWRRTAAAECGSSSSASKAQAAALEQSINIHRSPPLVSPNCRLHQAGSLIFLNQSLLLGATECFGGIRNLRAFAVVE